jgi:hypothetical protein
LLLTEHFFCWEAKISNLEDSLLIILNTTIEIERRIVMWKKLLILSLSITLLFCITASMTPVDAGGHRHRPSSIPINWRVAGSIVNFKTNIGPEDQIVVFLKAMGSPGPADLTVVGYASDAYVDNDEGCYPKIIFGGDEAVAVFTDLSMLFARLMDGGDSYICIGADGISHAKFEMEIFGGSGRFDGAKGYFTADIPAGFGHLFEGALSAESGKFIGRIEFDY